MARKLKNKRTNKKLIKNRKTIKSKKIQVEYGGGNCISGYVEDMIDNKFCCDDIAHYYDFKLQQQGGPNNSPNLNHHLKK